MGSLSAGSSSEISLVLAVSTIGKTDRFASFLESLRNQSDLNFVLGICDQTRNRDFFDKFQMGSLPFSYFITRSDVAGISAGRNAVIKKSLDFASHYFFPNDSTILDSNFIAELRTHLFATDLLVVGYEDGPNRLRYDFTEGTYALDRKNVWKILEPSGVCSKGLLLKAGLFDENIGTGCPSRNQSGEGTDLLLKVIDEELITKWLPNLRIQGVKQSYGLSKHGHRSKLYRYGHGYGFLLVKHKYGLLKVTSSIIAPIFKALFRLDDELLFLESIYSGYGRLLGALHGVRYRVAKQVKIFATGTDRAFSVRK